jgi:hypothetical protein
VVRIGCARRLLVCAVCYLLSDILLSIICYLLIVLLVVYYLLWQKMVWNLVINYGLVMMRWHRMMVYVAVEYEPVSVCQL